MATQVDNYYLSDAAITAEDPETLDALEDLMYKVSQIPGIVVATYETPTIMHGVKITVRKESNNA